jgi:hypothetical protein
LQKPFFAIFGPEGGIYMRQQYGKSAAIKVGGTGRHLDNFVKMGGAWRFAGRLLHVEWQEERALS